MDWNTSIQFLANEIESNKHKLGNLFCETNISAELLNINEAEYYSLKILDTNSYIHLDSYFRAIVSDEVIFTSSDENVFFDSLNHKLSSPAIINILKEKKLLQLRYCNLFTI